MLKKVTAVLTVIVMLTIICFELTSCKNAGGKRFQAEFLTMFDTVTQVVGYCESEEEFDEKAQLIHAELETYNKLYDIYNSYDGINNIRTINENAGKKPVKVDKKIIDMLKLSKEECTKTNGAVNVAMGAVLSIWHDYREAGIKNPEKAELPPIQKLKDASQHTDINKVIIDEGASTVFLEDPEMSLDVGAIAKGYAVEQVGRFALEDGFTKGLISVGGNVKAIGNKGFDNEPWNIGIQNPDQESENATLMTLKLKDMSLVTSGDYQRYYTVGEKKYHHIIDPKTLMPAEYFRSVSILTADSGVADALSTAVFNMPYDEGERLIESLSDTEAVWVFKNGEIKYSSGIKNYKKD